MDAASGEPDVSDLLSVDRAIAIIDGTPVSPRVVERPLQECVGLRLAEDLSADRPYPPFEKSLMDGYAVRCADIVGVPQELALVGEVAAGGKAKAPIQPGEALAIMTGAPIPPGADGIVPVEDVEEVRRFDPGAKRATIRVLRAPHPRRYIAQAGSDVASGVVVLRKGDRLEAAQLAVAASVGAGLVKVFAAPRVGVLATGDEIVPFDAQSVGWAQIRNSNNLMLQGLLSRLGCRVVDLGLCPDDPHRLRRSIVKGLQLDAVFITGGMSMGRYDYVPALLREMGVELKITKLRIKPGKPFVFGMVDRASLKGSEGEGGSTAPLQGPAYVFGLPGNPVSSFACTLRLASRLLTRLAGGVPREKWLGARLATALPANGPREFYQPVRLEYGEQLIAHTLAYKGSADLFSLAQANALLVRPENDPARGEGDMVRVLEI